MQYGVDLFGTGQVAKIFGVSPGTVAKWCKDGSLPCFRLPSAGRDRRVLKKDIIAFAESRGLPISFEDTAYGADARDRQRLLELSQLLEEAADLMEATAPLVRDQCLAGGSVTAAALLTSKVDKIRLLLRS